jgi:pilus assembly protein CpaE
MKPVSAAAAAETAAELVGREQHIAPAPRVSVQAFCETVETAAAIQAAGEDRRLSKAHLRIQMGGLTAAIEAYQNSPTPNVIAVVGAKGGVGASTVAHNIAFAISDDLILDAVVTDLDLPFGTAGLDFNQDPPQGIAEAVFSPDRIDNAFIDRLLAKCTDHLSLLAAPAALERVYDFGADAFEAIFDSLRATVPCIVVDVPHQWTGWTKQTLVGADEILIVAAPDLANLRNTKKLYDLLKAARPNDHRPLYCLNQVGVPKRPEIKAADFARALDDQPVAIIPFEPQLFGAAANNGQMIAEISASHRTAELFRQLAQQLTGRAEPKKQRSGLIPPLIEKLLQR